MKSAASKILPVNIALILIGLLDLGTTVAWLISGHIIEYNPIMAAVLKAGLPTFIAVKLATIIAYVAFMEWYRHHRSAAVAIIVGNFTVVSYICIYFVSFFCVNSSFLGS